MVDSEEPADQLLDLLLADELTFEGKFTVITRTQLIFLPFTLYPLP
ncbi:MAG: hypothetical protein ACFE0I_00215 [Elainellaceae cyanobacterium]